MTATNNGGGKYLAGAAEMLFELSAAVVPPQVLVPLTEAVLDCHRVEEPEEGDALFQRKNLCSGWESCRLGPLAVIS
jgi:hypothetical protein